MTEQQAIDEGYTEGKKSFEYLWNKIEPYFKWEKVHQIMKATDWNWCIDKDKNLYGIPAIETIKQSARKLLFDVWEQEKGTISSGGFMAGYDDGNLWLSFVAEDCHTCDL